MKHYAYDRNGGHAKSHVRDAFLEAIELFINWRPGAPEPTVEFEERQITLTEACGLVWNCSDVLPGDYCSLFNERLGSYAAAARVMKRALSG